MDQQFNRKPNPYSSQDRPDQLKPATQPNQRGVNDVTPSQTRPQQTQNQTLSPPQPTIKPVETSQQQPQMQADQQLFGSEKKRIPRKKIILIVATVLSLIIALGLVYVFLLSSNAGNGSTEQEASPEEEVVRTASDGYEIRENECYSLELSLSRFAAPEQDGFCEIKAFTFDSHYYDFWMLPSKYGSYENTVSEMEAFAKEQTDKTLRAVADGNVLFDDEAKVKKQIQERGLPKSTEISVGDRKATRIDIITSVGVEYVFVVVESPEFVNEDGEKVNAFNIAAYLQNDEYKQSFNDILQSLVFADSETQQNPPDVEI